MADRYPHITAATRLLALLGHPVDHSLSPLIQNAALQADRVNMVYLAFDVSPEQLGMAVQGLRAVAARGANVTVPHKEYVIDHLDRLDALAAQVGAVNTIVNDDGVLTGHNTDVEGFRAALHRVVPEDLRRRSCLVVGAGGAARAVVAALCSARVSDILVANRTRERAEALCAAATGWGVSSCRALGLDELHEAASSADILVNATSIGLDPTVKECALPVDTLNRGQVVIDVVYGPGPTLLVEEARARGIVALDGLEMLLMQAASSYKLWTRHEAPLEVMRAALAERSG